MSSESDRNAALQWSSGYRSARRDFLEASRRQNLEVSDWINPSGDAAMPLVTHAAYAGPANPEHVLVIGSGTHGVEGLCGSMVQCDLVSSGVSAALPAGLALLLIHAINPFGFAFIRRADETNVDVNRNFIDHTLPQPQNPGYDELADAIAPDSISVLVRIASHARLLKFGMVHGGRSLRLALSRGQYSHPQGLFYGGGREAWSNRTFRLIADKYLAAKRITFVDVHTGFGKHGAAEIYHRHLPGTPVQARVEVWWGRWAKPPLRDQSVSNAEFGTITDALPAMRPDAETTSVTLEFGTFPPPTVFRALQRENWVHHHLPAGDPRASRIKAELLRAFFPGGPAWTSAVLGQFREIVRKVMV
jgi:hypothetical protein